MPATGISINVISLFAFILVLGIVVDDAIVVGENVYRRMRSGEHPSIAAPKGTHEVGVVVIFGILTTMTAFTPMLGLSGVSGKIWPNIPLIVIPTLLFSLLQSKLILPAHLALLPAYDPNRKRGFIMRFQNFFARGLERFVDLIYRPILRVALGFRWVVLTGFVCLLLVCFSYVTNGHIRFEFLPTIEGDVISCKIKLSEGVPFDATQRAVDQLTEAGKKLGDEFKDFDGNPVTRNILGSAGSQPFVLGFEGLGGIPKATNLGEVTIELQPAVNREWDTDELISRWRELTGPIPGAVEVVYRTETASGGNAIDLELTGPSTSDLQAATEDMKAALGNIEGVIEISDSDKAGKRELKLEILPQAEALGLRLSDIANQVRQGFFGEEIQRLQRGKNEVLVYVRYPRDERKSIADLETIRIRTPDGTEVPFSQVATATFGRSPSVIQRTDGQRAIQVTADVDKAKGANANEVVAALNQGLESQSEQWKLNLRNQINEWTGREIEVREDGAMKKILNQYPGVKMSFQGEQKDQNESVAEMMEKFILALLGMYILMAIPLKSYIQPMIIMSVIPFGLIGAVFGHIVMGYNLSIMSMCGIIALAGVVVNDSLVLVDYVNRERAKGHDMRKAAWEAGAARFRPILLTSLTTFAGLTPMLLATDLQAKFLIPMAISLSFGILFATVITLVLVPCVYLMINDLQKFVKEAAS
jgi:multidrug efflux pump subunit AcrB